MGGLIGEHDVEEDPRSNPPAVAAVRVGGHGPAAADLAPVLPMGRAGFEGKWGRWAVLP
jgi:hypothetical protein